MICGGGKRDGRGESDEGGRRHIISFSSIFKLKLLI